MNYSYAYFWIVYSSSFLKLFLFPGLGMVRFLSQVFTLCTIFGRMPGFEPELLRLHVARRTTNELHTSLNCQYSWPICILTHSWSCYLYTLYSRICLNNRGEEDFFFSNNNSVVSPPPPKPPRSHKARSQWGGGWCGGRALGKSLQVSKVLHNGH